MIPSGYKEDVVYSPIPTNGSGDLSFTRASNGTRVNSAGLVEVTPWNLFTYSEQPNNADWSGGGNGKPTMTDNFAEAPNGTMTASKMEVAGTGYQIRQNNAQENTQMNVSVWLRTNTGTKTIQLFLNNANTASQNITVTTTWTRYEISGLVTTLSGSGRNGLQTLEALTSGAYILVWGLQLSVGLTAKPYFPTTDRLNVPRLTYQNGGGGCPSLLLEKQSTNVLTYSEQFDNAAWTKGGSNSVTANAIISPDGTQNADFLVSTATNTAAKYAYQVIASTATPTATIYAKAGAVTEMMFYCQGGNGIYFNLTNGAFIAYYGSGSSTITSYSSVAVGNGWYRYSLTFNTSVTSVEVYMSVSANISPSIANGDGLYIWGAQLEASSYPTSYIPTTSASATRVADACSKTGISSLIGQTEGVLFADVNWIVKPEAGSPVIGIVTLNNNVANLDNCIILGIERQSGGTNRVYCLVQNSGSTVAGLFGSNITNGRYKIALAYKNNDFVLYVNGVQIATDTSGTPPTTSEVLLGPRFQGDSFSMNDSINQAVLFKTRLTNAELASLTTI
jgi:hypothetical protein